MKTEYPFPVPQSTLDRIHYRSKPLHELYCKGWKATDYLPLGLKCFEVWQMKVNSLMELFADCLMGEDSEEAWGVYHALEHYLDDFSSLLSVARSSLPYDPVMQNWIAEASEKTLIATESEADEDEREALTTEEPRPPIQ